MEDHAWRRSWPRSEKGYLGSRPKRRTRRAGHDRRELPQAIAYFRKPYIAEVERVSKVITVNMSTEKTPNKIKRVWTELGKGPRRALIVGWPVCIMVSTYIASQMSHRSHRAVEFGFFWSLIYYWPLVLICLWIYRGFRADK